MLPSPPDETKPLVPRITRQRGTKPRSLDPAYRRDEALAGLQDRRGPLVRHATRRLIELALTGATVSADDLRDIETGPISRQFVGAVVRLLRKRGILRAIGYHPSAAPGSHARPILFLQLDDRAAAERWLIDHPPFPPPPKTQQHLPGVEQ